MASFFRNRKGFSGGSGSSGGGIKEEDGKILLEVKPNVLLHDGRVYFTNEEELNAIIYYSEEKTYVEEVKE